MKLLNYSIVGKLTCSVEWEILAFFFFFMGNKLFNKSCLIWGYFTTTFSMVHRSWNLHHSIISFTWFSLLHLSKSYDLLRLEYDHLINWTRETLPSRLKLRWKSLCATAHFTLAVYCRSHMEKSRLANPLTPGFALL